MCNIHKQRRQEERVRAINYYIIIYGKLGELGENALKALVLANSPFPTQQGTLGIDGDNDGKRGCLLGKEKSLHIIYYHWYFWYFGNYARKPLALANSRNTTFGKKLVKVVVGEGRRVKSPPRYPFKDTMKGFFFIKLSDHRCLSVFSLLSGEHHKVTKLFPVYSISLFGVHGEPHK